MRYTVIILLILTGIALHLKTGYDGPLCLDLRNRCSHLISLRDTNGSSHFVDGLHRIYDTAHLRGLSFVDRREGKQADIAERIDSYVMAINPRLQQALLKNSVFLDESGELIRTYPKVCLRAAVAGKALLEREFSNAVNRGDIEIEIVHGTAADPNALIFSHEWLEIKTHDGRRYYLSFTDGQFDRGFMGLKNRVVFYVLDEDGQTYDMDVYTNEYRAWFQHGHDYVTFVDLTDDEVYTSYLATLGGGGYYVKRRTKSTHKALRGSAYMAIEEVADILKDLDFDNVATMAILFGEAKDRPLARLLGALRKGAASILGRIIKPRRVMSAI